MSVTQAMKRDATWYRRPRAVGDMSSAPDWIGKYHVAVGGAFPTAACSGVPLTDWTAVPAGEVHTAARCMRAACKNRWAALNTDKGQPRDA